MPGRSRLVLMAIGLLLVTSTQALPGFGDRPSLAPRSALVTVAASVLFVVAQALRIDTSIETSRDWVFLAKFCFSGDGGTIDLLIESTAAGAGQAVSFYYDIESDWEYIISDSTPCFEKVRKRALSSRCSTTFACAGGSRFLDGLLEFDAGGKATGMLRSLALGCAHLISLCHQVSAPFLNWWFVAVHNCGVCFSSSLNATVRGLMNINRTRCWACAGARSGDFAVPGVA